MHRLPSKSVIWRFRFASFLIIASPLVFLIFLGYMAYGVWLRDPEWIIRSGWIFRGVMIAVLLNFIISARLRCPLCFVQPLLNRGCSKHRNVKKILSSHKLYVALSILATSRFTCPYCGEKTVLKTRSERH